MGLAMSYIMLGMSFASMVKNDNYLIVSLAIMFSIMLMHYFSTFEMMKLGPIMAGIVDLLLYCRICCLDRIGSTSFRN